MLLKRITVTGFKSFANKTVLDLEPGVTAVVGPNGSGKSNLADAVRWALGERALSRLRLSDREEVVFAGSDQRPRASYAEVVLLFDNEDGAFPLDLTEVEISRRLYRSGETDYRVAGRSVKLAEVQALMAQAGFGAGSYAVIGQGTIDTFLTAPPAERKLLFDEAVGIRAPELARAAALRKLAATETNLTRLRDLAAELAPRLTPDVPGNMGATAAEVQRRLEAGVAAARTALVTAGVAHWMHVHAETSEQLRAAEQAAHEQRALHAELEQQLAAEQAKAAAVREQAQLQHALGRLEHDRDQLSQRLATARAGATAARQAATDARELERQLTAAQAELGAARDRTSELEAELAANMQAAGRAQTAVDRTSRAVAGAQAALVALRQDADSGTRDQYVDHALQILRTLAVTLSSEDTQLEHIRLLVHKAGRLLSYAGRAGAAELLAELQKAQRALETAMTKRETAVEHQTNITITRRSLEIDLDHQRAAVDRAITAVRELEARLGRLQAAAVELATRQAEVGELELAARQATTIVEQQRRQLAAHTTSATVVRTQTELAAARERAASAVVTAKSQLADLTPHLATAAAELAAIRDRAAEWDITLAAKAAAAPAASRRPLPELESDLIRAEAALEAYEAARRDQTAAQAAAEARHAELAAQIADLEAARDNLAQVAAELDQRVQDRFTANFARLGEQFNHYFGRLFEGGSASLKLESAGDDGAYGVAINVSPKGKRMNAISALSGGERALAGVALLAAIMSTNPSPFVVLDEIDAALDEANSGRLSGILTELQAHTQLIIITHNRQTMHAARVLFGVTMTDQHVSRLISMRLEDATALAAR